MKNANDIAGKAISKRELKNVQWMLPSRIRRGETLKLKEFDKRLVSLLRKRATEMEADRTLEPKSVTDWMALALFAEDRRRFEQRCERAEFEQDATYKNATFWLERLVKERYQRESD